MDEKESIKNEAIDETVEKEIVISLCDPTKGLEIDAKENDKNDSKDSVLTDDENLSGLRHSAEPKSKSTNKFVEQKAVAQLTEDERSLIIRSTIF